MCIRDRNYTGHVHKWKHWIIWSDIDPRGFKMKSMSEYVHKYLDIYTWFGSTQFGHIGQNQGGVLRYLSEPRVLAANTWWLKLISPPSIPYRLQWVLYTNTTEASYVNRHPTGWWLDVIYFVWELYCWVRIEEYDWWRKPTTIVSLVRWSNSTPRRTCANLPRY